MRALVTCLTLSILTGLAALPAQAQTDIQETEQADFTLVTLADGLDHPWSLAPMPNGDFLVSERPGRLRYIAEGRLRPEPVTGLPDVLADNQGGLLGLALHPEFETTRWVYFAFSEGTSSANHTALGRGRLSEDGTSLEAVETLFRVNIDKARGYHFGGRIAFLADGTLILSLGDGGLYRDEAQNLYRDEAQNLSNHLGTIIRLNEDGTVPFDNPFASARGAQPEIYSWGHRNVQGIAINPQTGSVWVNEHGPRGGDEINSLRSGRNYGWPVISYGINYDGTPVSDATHAEGIALRRSARGARRRPAGALEDERRDFGARCVVAPLGRGGRRRAAAAAARAAAGAAAAPRYAAAGGDAARSAAARRRRGGRRIRRRARAVGAAGGDGAVGRAHGGRGVEPVARFAAVVSQSQDF